MTDRLSVQGCQSMRRPDRPLLLSLAIGVFAVALIVATWAAILSLTRLAREEAVTAARRHNQTIAAALEVYVARTMRNASGVLAYVDREYRQEGRDLDAAGITRSIDTRLYNSIALTDQSGRVLYSFVNAYPAGHDLSLREEHRAYDRARAPYMHIGRPVRSATTGEMVIPISKARVASDGRFLGMVVAELRPQSLLGLFGDGRAAPGGSMSLARRDGTLLVSHAAGRLRFGTDLRRSPVLTARRRSPHGTIRTTSLLDGVERDLSYRTVGAFPELIVTLGTSTAEILEPVERARRGFYFGASLTTLLVIAVAAALILSIYRKSRGERAMRQLVDRLHAAQRLAAIGDWRVDVKAGTLFWSPQMYRFFGRDPALGPPALREAADVVGPEMQRRGQEAFEAARQTGRQQGFDCTLAGPGGDPRHYQVTVAAVRDADGEVVQMAGTMQDVSERRKVESLQDELARLARLDAVNAMAATLAHELNQPLAAAANYLSTARYLSDQIAHEKSGLLGDQLAHSEEQIQRAGQIIRRIRNMISQTSNAKEPVRIDRIVGEALAVVAMAKICPGTTIRIDGTGRDLCVLADAVQIQQVLLNLVRNACEAQADAEEPQVWIEIEPEGDMVRIAVCDRGPGIPEAIRDKLFDPFSSSKSGGLGLGLSISRAIVEAHDGRIWATSEAGQGSAVHFTLPRTEPISNASPPSATEPRASSAA